MARPNRSFGEPENDFVVDSVAAIKRPVQKGETVQQIEKELIDPNPYQPRTTFDPVALQELADSIKANGIQQPLILTENTVESGRYWIVTGGRRYKAGTELAGLTHVPAIVRPATNKQMMVLAYVENDQRAPLDPIDDANALLRMQQEFGYSLSELSEATGKPKGTISNVLRLLDLPEFVQIAVKSGEISPTAAKAMIKLASRHRDIERLMNRVIKEGLTTRQIEAEVEAILAEIEDRKVAKNQPEIGVNQLSPHETPVKNDEVSEPVLPPHTASIAPINQMPTKPEQSPIPAPKVEPDFVQKIAPEVAKSQQIIGVNEPSPHETPTTELTPQPAPKRRSLASIAAEIVPVEKRKKTKASFNVIFDMLEECGPEVLEQLAQALTAHAAAAR